MVCNEFIISIRAALVITPSLIAFVVAFENISGTHSNAHTLSAIGLGWPDPCWYPQGMETGSLSEKSLFGNGRARPKKRGRGAG